MRAARVLERAALVAAAVTALTLGFERIDPSLGLTQDFRLTNLRAALAVTLVLWVLACGVGRRWPRVPRPLALPTVAWLAVLTLSAVLAPTHQTQALAFTRDVVIGSLLAWAVYDLVAAQTRWLLPARALAVGGLAVAVVGIGEAANLPPVTDWVAGFRYQPNFDVGEITRVSSTLPHPNIAAMLVGLTLPVLLAWTVSLRISVLRGLGVLAVMAELVMLVLTLSRAGVLTTELVIGLMAAVGWWRNQPVLTGFGLGALVALPAVIIVFVLAQPILLLRMNGEGVQGWYSADYSTPESVTAQPGQATTVPVRLANVGSRTWNASGNHPFALSYHLAGADGTPVTFDGARTQLPGDVAPGGAVDLQAVVVAPPSAGAYVVEWDEVQDSVTWFSWTGSPMKRTKLTVAGPPVALADVTFTRTPQPLAGPPPPPDRLTLWRIALRMARNRPLLGIGPDNFRWVYGDFAGVSQWDTGSHANSMYFDWLADTGVLGLGAFAWLSWRLLRASLRGLFVRTADAYWIWRLALAASLIAWFVHGTVDYFYGAQPTNLGFWFVAGLAVAASQDRKVTSCA